MICVSCGREATTRHVVFRRTIGVLVFPFFRTVDGNLCKSCIREYFWTYTITNLTLGWWGVFSIFVAPFFILNNIATYLACLSMEPVPPGALAPKLTAEDVQKIGPHTEHLIECLNRRISLDQVWTDVASRAGVLPGQAMLYAHLLFRQSQNYSD